MLYLLRRGNTREFVRQNRQLRGQMRLLWSDVQRLIERQRELLEQTLDRSKGFQSFPGMNSLWQEFQYARGETQEAPRRQVAFAREEIDASTSKWRRKAIALLNEGVEFTVKNLSLRQLKTCTGLAGNYGIVCQVEEVAIDRESVYPKRLRFSRRDGIDGE